MKILEKLQKRMLAMETEKSIQSREHLELFVSGYLQGIADQYGEYYMSLCAEELEKINNWMGEHFKKSFYFTFGSFEGFPFQNGYIIVYAENINDAARRFKEKYPNERDEEIINCSDYYGEEYWSEHVAGLYRGYEPYEVMK